MSMFPGAEMYIEQKAEEARHVAAIIEAAIPNHEEQMRVLHAVYDLHHAGEYETVALILDILQGAWV